MHKTALLAALAAITLSGCALPPQTYSDGVECDPYVHRDEHDRYFKRQYVPCERRIEWWNLATQLEDLSRRNKEFAARLVQKMEDDDAEARRRRDERREEQKRVTGCGQYIITEGGSRHCVNPRTTTRGQVD